MGSWGPPWKPIENLELFDPPPMRQMEPNWSPNSIQGIQNISKMEVEGKSGGSPKLIRRKPREKSADLHETSLFTLLREGLPMSQTIDVHRFGSPK